MQSLAIALWVEDAFCQCSRLAAKNAVGLKHVTIAQMREGSRRVQELDVLANATAAAPPSGSAGVGNEAEMADAYGIEGLMHLDRNVGAVHDRGHALKAILAVASAVTRQRHVVHDEGAAGAIVNAADVRVGPMRKGAHCPLRQCL